MGHEPGSTITLFLCGDVMTGRGIDQVLPHPCPPRLYEPYMRSAEGYVSLAERASGSIPRPAGFDYVWGDALDELTRAHPAARIVNLETAVTTSEDAWRDKGIHYRMHPANLPCLTAAGIDCCVLANNHTLDWGRAGLAETLEALRAAGIATVGAGRDAGEAAQPATLDLAPPFAPARRVLVFAFALPSAGVPADWAARAERSGVNFLPELSAEALRGVARDVAGARRGGDLAVVSLHWGANWGYEIGDAERAFAHRLIDEAGADIVFGHSSHHPKGIEVHRGKAILYGCGDFINDYEGIGGYGEFRPELGLMYLPQLEAGTGRLVELRMVPMRRLRFHLQRAAAADARWLAKSLERASDAFGTRIAVDSDLTLVLR